MMVIYALGHSNYSFEKFITIIKEYNLNCIVDIRSIPYSKYNVQYNKEDFSKRLKELGYTYIYMADQFGVKRDDKSSYNSEGYADFDKVRLEKSFRRGVERLKDGCKKGYRIVLLGAVQEPIRCPRAILVGRELEKEGFDVRYIVHEGGTISQRDIENQMLDKYFKDRSQITIENLLGIDNDREELIDKCYKLANREIGFRVEKL